MAKGIQRCVYVKGTQANSKTTQHKDSRALAGQALENTQLEGIDGLTSTLIITPSIDVHPRSYLSGLHSLTCMSPLLVPTQSCT